MNFTNPGVLIILYFRRLNFLVDRLLNNFSKRYRDVNNVESSRNIFYFLYCTYFMQHIAIFLYHALAAIL